MAHDSGSNPTDPPDPWTRYYRLRKITFVLWAAWFPFIALLVVLPHRLVFDAGRYVLLAITIPWSCALAASALWLNYWSCPQCGKLFFLRFGIWKTSGKACPHCGLRYSERPSAPAAD